MAAETSSSSSDVDDITKGMATVMVSNEESDASKAHPYFSREKLGTVVFLGEGNFTFCRAFAAWRGSWSGIVPTELTVANSWNFELNKNNAEDKYQTALKRLEVEPPDKISLNATNMGTRVDLAGRLGVKGNGKLTLWFQCPWSKGNERVSKLVTDFITSAARIQQAGEYLVIGVCTIKKYFERYCLPRGDNPMDYYKEVGTDADFVGHMGARGYVWTSSKPDSTMTLNYGRDFRIFIFTRN